MLAFQATIWLLTGTSLCHATASEAFVENEIQPKIRTIVARQEDLSSWSALPIYGRSDGSAEVIKPKLFIVSLFSPEAAVWPGPLKLYANNITVPGFSPILPQAYCDKKGQICQVITGEGEINAASTISALVASSFFDLTKTYFFIAGIAGINPACGTIGGVNLARFVVQNGLEYEIATNELAKNYSREAGFIPLGQQRPNSYPIFIYGTEVFEVSAALRDRAFLVMKSAKLEDSETANQYRKKYKQATARSKPNVFKGVTSTSDVYWHGKVIGKAFADYDKKLTNGTGHYCMTAQEDSAVLEALLRGNLARKVDFYRILAMRTGANFDRPPPGESAAQSLFLDQSGGFPLSLANIYHAGKHFVHDVIINWDRLYGPGLSQTNYVGDIFRSIKGQPFKPDIGPPVAGTG